MHRWTSTAAAILAVMILSGQTAPAETGARAQARSKVQARRAARDSALRGARNELAARILALPVTAKQTVGDLADADPKLAAGLKVVIGDLADRQTSRKTDDRRQAITITVSHSEVYTQLQSLYARSARAEKAVAAAIARRIVEAGDKTIRVTGAASASRALRGATGGRSLAVPTLWRLRCSEPGWKAAREIAETDAARKLRRNVGRLRITKEVAIADFLRNRAQAKAEFADFLTAKAKVGAPLYRTNELIVDVTMEIRLQEVVAKLADLRQRYAPKAKIQPRDIQGMIDGRRPAQIGVIGSGAPPERYLLGAKTVPTKTTGPLKRPRWPRTIRATGSATVQTAAANVGQAHLRAMRAAEKRARADLTAKINSLPIRPGMTVGRFTEETPSAKADLDARVRKARIVTSRITKQDKAEAVVEIDSDPIWQIVQKRWSTPRPAR